MTISKDVRNHWILIKKEYHVDQVIDIMLLLEEADVGALPPPCVFVTPVTILEL